MTHKRFYFAPAAVDEKGRAKPLHELPEGYSLVPGRYLADERLATAFAKHPRKEPGAEISFEEHSGNHFEFSDYYPLERIPKLVGTGAASRMTLLVLRHLSKRFPKATLNCPENAAKPFLVQVKKWGMRPGERAPVEEWVKKIRKYIESRSRSQGPP